jgi:hypothetical protein
MQESFGSSDLILVAWPLKQSNTKNSANRDLILVTFQWLDSIFEACPTSDDAVVLGARRIYLPPSIIEIETTAQ